MIYISEHNLTIEKPEDINRLSVDVKNTLFSNLEKGRVIIEIPEDFDFLDKKVKPKWHKNNYKIGFIYDCLTILYPQYGKEKKHQIIRDKFHFDFSYRRFKDLYQYYDDNRNLYLENRKFLGLPK